MANVETYKMSCSFHPFILSFINHQGHIQSWLVVMTPKKICPNIKSVFFEINLFASFTKTSSETFHVFPIDKPLNSKCGKRICNFSVNKTTKCFQRHIQNPAKHLRRLKYILKQVYMGNLKFL